MAGLEKVYPLSYYLKAAIAGPTEVFNMDGESAGTPTQGPSLKAHC
jgi:hypothetical protein